jgi:hypothetical protein
MVMRDRATGYSRGPDPLFVALLSVAVVVVALIVVMVYGA